MKVTASVITLIASASAASYQWVGRPTNFNDALNWQPYGSSSNSGVSPVGLSLNSQPSEVHVGQQNEPPLTVNVEARGQDYKVGSMIQFDGSATLILGDGNAGSTTTLTFDTSNTNANAIVFSADDEFDCSSNWVMQGGQSVDRTASEDCPVPTNSDTIMLGPVGTFRIDFGGNTVSRALSFPACDTATPTVATNTRVTAMFDTSCTRALNGRGRDDVCSLSADRCRDSDDQATADIASATTNPTSADSDSDKIIIIVVIVAVVLILAVIGVVVVIVKNQTAGGVDDRGQVSFENPMYDQTGKPQEQQQNATYAEPMASSGYMDVPAGGGGGGGSGYMDVAPTGGYMDVAPNQGTTGYMDVSAGFDDDDAEDV
jgi:hypothetical protein